MNAHIFKRDELYNEVWSMPMSKLAKNYTISDVGLAKICKKMNIPVPPRGYWAKKSAGKKTVIIPLPQETKSTINEYDHYCNESSNVVKETGNTYCNELEITRLKGIKISRTSLKYHPLVEHARKYLLSEKPNPQYPIITPFGEVISLKVSIKNMDRGLRIMDTIIKNIEELGGRIELDKQRYNPLLCNTYAVIHEEKIAFSLREKFELKKHIPTKDELKKMNQYSWDRPPENDHVPSNKFILEIDEYGIGLQQKWQDTPTASLDDKLGDFIIGLLKIAPYIKQRRLDEIERERKQQEENDRRRKEQARIEEEQRKIKILESHLDMYAKTGQINTYIEVFEKTFNSVSCSPERKEVLLRWIGWVKEYRDKINPFNPDDFLYEKQN